MNNIPLLQQALGESWEKLPSVIQRHYCLSSSQNTSSVVHGSMTIDYPAFVKPILIGSRLLGALIHLKGGPMKVRVEKWIRENSNALYWQRDIEAPDGSKTVFSSRMELDGDGQLIETVGFGFGIRLKISANDSGQLIYRSNGYIWNCGPISLPIADALLLGHATIIETPISKDEFELDFKIHHPLFGQTYSYGGVFHYA